MNVRVSSRVRRYLTSFYQASLALHPSLDEATVIRKRIRLEQYLLELGNFPYSKPVARVKSEWKEAGYREAVFEDFIFAYHVCTDKQGNLYVFVCDVVYCTLNH